MHIPPDMIPQYDIDYEKLSQRDKAIHNKKMKPYREARRKKNKAAADSRKRNRK